ncbi:lipase family protein [Paenibacillus abyssi]|uniref:Lipase n=1 Tax=Paenibacillus abyssi TaxID=1340531 RepID=A0A917CQI7_9BACL|nr:lipase family protein [Paenibacillus abyssi]GGF95517.1 lipase [Paenibacillus abyssi]
MAKQTMPIGNALFLAAVCGQTYVQHNNKDGLFLAPHSYSSVDAIEAQSYNSGYERFGFILESDQALIVAFRGTSTAVEWVSDFIARQTPYLPVKDFGLTHKGFTDIYMSAREQLLRALNKYSHQKPLFVTGHSLGGALATLAAPDIAANTPFRNPHVYTFASPRVGNPQFVRNYNQIIPVSWRICNEHDIVPHLPPLIYRSPKTDKTYYYLHVKDEYKFSFLAGSVPGNHVIRNYFSKLSKEDPHFTKAMCSFPPAWCPDGID